MKPRIRLPNVSEWNFTGIAREDLWLASAYEYARTREWIKNEVRRWHRKKIRRWEGNSRDFHRWVDGSISVKDVLILRAKEGIPLRIQEEIRELLHLDLVRSKAEPIITSTVWFPSRCFKNLPDLPGRAGFLSALRRKPEDPSALVGSYRELEYQRHEFEHWIATDRIFLSEYYRPKIGVRERNLIRLEVDLNEPDGAILKAVKEEISRVRRQTGYQPKKIPGETKVCEQLRALAALRLSMADFHDADLAEHFPTESIEGIEDPLRLLPSVKPSGFHKQVGRAKGVLQRWFGKE